MKSFKVVERKVAVVKGKVTFIEREAGEAKVQAFKVDQEFQWWKICADIMMDDAEYSAKKQDGVENGLHLCASE